MGCARAIVGHGGTQYRPYVANNRGIDRTADDGPRADGRTISSVRAIRVLPLLGDLLLGQSLPTTAADAGRRFGPTCRELGVPGDRRRNPLTRRGLVRLRTGQLPAYPSNLPDSAAAPSGTLTAILSNRCPTLRPTRQGKAEVRSSRAVPTTNREALLICTLIDSGAARRLRVLARQRPRMVFSALALGIRQTSPNP